MLCPPVRGVGRGSAFASIARPHVRSFRTWSPVANGDHNSSPGDKRRPRARNVPSLDQSNPFGGRDKNHPVVDRVRDIKTKDSGRGSSAIDSSSLPATTPSRSDRKVHNLDNLTIRGGGVLADALNQVEGVDQSWKSVTKMANFDRRKKERSDKARSFQRKMDEVTGKRREHERAAAEDRGKAIFAKRQDRRQDSYTAAPNWVRRRRGKEIASPELDSLTGSSVQKDNDIPNEVLDDELAAELWEDIRKTEGPSSAPLASDAIVDVPGFGLVRHAKLDIWSDLPSALQPTGDFEADSTRYWPVESSDWDDEVDNEEDEAEEDQGNSQSGDLLWKEEMEPIEEWAPPVLQPFDGDQERLLQENINRKKFNEQHQRPQKDKDGKIIFSNESASEEFESVRAVPLLTNEQPYWSRFVPEPDVHQPETMYINDYEPGFLLDNHFLLGVAPVPYGKVGKALAAEVARKSDDGLGLRPWVDEKTGMFDALGITSAKVENGILSNNSRETKEPLLAAEENQSSSMSDDGQKITTTPTSDLLSDQDKSDHVVSHSNKLVEELPPDAAHVNLLRLLNKATSPHPALRKQRNINIGVFIKESIRKGSSDFIREHWSNAQRNIYATLQEPNKRPSDAYWPLEGNYTGQDDPLWKKHWQARQNTEDWMAKLDNGTNADYVKDKLWRKYDNVWEMGPQAHILAEYGAYDDYFWKRLSEELTVKKEKLNFLADKASETAWQIQRHGRTPAMVKRLARLEKEFDRREEDIDMVKKEVWKRLTGDLPHGRPSEVLETLDDQERWDKAAVQLGYKRGEVSMDPQWGPGQAEAFEAFIGMMMRQRAEVGLGGSYNNPSYSHTNDLQGSKMFTDITARLAFQNPGLDRGQKRELIEVMGALEREIIEPVFQEESQKAETEKWVEVSTPIVGSEEEKVQGDGLLGISDEERSDIPQEDYATWKTKQFGEDSNSTEK